VNWSKDGANAVTGWFDFIRHSVASIGNDIASPFETAFKAVAGWLNSTGSSVTRFFQALPGTLLGIINNLASDLFVAGENVIIGFYNGLVSAFNSLIGGIGNIGHDIANALGSVFGIHFSEPSEATQMVKAGLRIPEALAKGITQGQPAVTAAMARTEHTINTAMPCGTGAGGAQKLQVQFVGAGNDPLWQLFKKNIRIKGGNVQIVGA
jgi:phage-related protein